ncbi:MAG: U32 family peptidase [Clostridia bacterium]|nr:U32 family peptidase [Clostridia bacterium]
MNRRPEVLAPAGSMEALRAAVECGADAVYLGAGSFNARRNARNFSREELAEAIEYCHRRGVKVHLTLNTLVSDEELPAALDLLEQACAFGVDALIVQDLGVAALARAAAPDLELHASTQAAVMTPEGFRELAALGFRRAVLPREFSLEEILAVREATKDTGLELEMFIHGALCMCVSGQCYLSAYMGGRSGNRGLCAQPCRLRFAAEDGRRSDHALSLKDLSAVEAIPLLFEAGVTSFKIEGRMKRPEYVAAAVTACRNSVEGVREEALLEQLDAVFSRSGHTEGYLKGHLGHDMFGTRRKDDVVAAAPILKSLEELYRKDTRGTPVKMDFTARLGAPMTLTVQTTETGVSAFTDSSEEYTVEAAQNAGTSKDKVLAQLLKTGGTGFTVAPEDISIELNEGIYLPVSAINALRRNALEQLGAVVTREAVRPFDRAAAEKLLQANGREFTESALRDTRRVVRLSSETQLPQEAPSGVSWLLPLGTKPKDDRPFGVELPRGLYENKEHYKAQLVTAKENGARFAYAGTLDGVALAKEAGLPVLGGFTLNVFNHIALEEYRKLGVECLALSQELKLSQMRELLERSALRRGLGMLVYGRAPLMLTRNCPDGLRPENFGAEKLPTLTDRKGVRFPVTTNGDAYELLNSVPIYLGDKQDDLPNDLFRLLWFTEESPSDVAAILDRYESGTPADFAFTRGLSYKGVL